MNKFIKGQSIVEFIIVSSVIIPFLIIVPLIAKVSNVKLKTQAAADFASWRNAKEINTDSPEKIKYEVSKVFFTKPGEKITSIVDEEADKKIASNETNHFGEVLVDWKLIETEKTSSSFSDYTDKAAKLFENELVGDSLALDKIKVSVPVNTNTPFDEISKSLTIESHSVSFNGDWSSSGPDYTKKIIKQSKAMIAYENGIKQVTNFVSKFINLFEKSENELNVEDVYQMDTVPEDRIKIIR